MYIVTVATVVNT